MAGTPRISALRDLASSVGLPPARKWRRQRDNRHPVERYHGALPHGYAGRPPLPHSCHNAACI